MCINVSVEEFLARSSWRWMSCRSEETASAADLVNSARRLLADPAAACAQDLGEILASGQKMSRWDFTADAQRGAERLVHLGQLLSLGLVAREIKWHFIHGGYISKSDLLQQCIISDSSGCLNCGGGSVTMKMCWSSFFLTEPWERKWLDEFLVE